MANYIVQFPLKVEKYQKDVLEKRFRIGRDIYNSLLRKMMKKYDEMRKQRVYRELLHEIANTRRKNHCIKS